VPFHDGFKLTRRAFFAIWRAMGAVGDNGLCHEKPDSP
jgi:hypothetical protein